MNFSIVNMAPENAGVVAADAAQIVLQERDQDWVGKVQVGAGISLGMKMHANPSQSTRTILPDSPPAVRIYSNSSILGSYTVPVDTTSGSSVGVFRGTYTPGRSDSPAQHVALFCYSVAGVPVAALESFEVLPGGHAGGPIISTFSFVFPSGGSFIAHAGSGYVVRGLRPYLDQGD